jgi:tRNA pseudouridine55 synthase
VSVHGIQVLGYEWPVLRLRIDCGRGMYVRSLARDIAQALETAGYVAALRRTRVGELWASKAVVLEAMTAGNIQAFLQPIVLP